MRGARPHLFPFIARRENASRPRGTRPRPGPPGALLRGRGPCGAVVASSLLADALRYDAASFQAWYAYGATESGAEAERHLHHAVTLAAAAPVFSCGELPLLL